jgi:hypothetical protein
LFTFYAALKPKENYDEHIDNRITIYRINCKESLRSFHVTGYPHILLEAVNSYAIMREYALQFGKDYPDFDKLYQEAKLP